MSTLLPMRRLGSSVIHLVDIDPAVLSDMTSFGAPFVGSTEPVVTVCGSALRGVTVWMRTTKKACHRCVRWSADADVVPYPKETVG